MKIRFSPKDGVEFEIEANDQVDAIEQMAKHSEIFGIKQCGACKSTDIRFQHRTVQKQTGKKIENFDYHELVCNNYKCRARLSFGKLQNDARTVFPKRKDSEGNYLENNGWVVFKGKKSDEGGGDDVPDSTDASF